MEPFPYLLAMGVQMVCAKYPDDRAPDKLVFGFHMLALAVCVSSKQQSRLFVCVAWEVLLGDSHIPLSYHLPSILEYDLPPFLKPASLRPGAVYNHIFAP